jgi:hypothetical protein
MVHMQRTRSVELVEVEGRSSRARRNENERIWQRRAAIGVVFILFFVIFGLCMVAIYGGINPKGLVLRETFSIRNSTLPKTTAVPFWNSSQALDNFTETLDFNASQSSTESSNISTLAFSVPTLDEVEGVFQATVSNSAESSVPSKDPESEPTSSPIPFAFTSVRHARHRSTEMFKRHQSDLLSTHSTNAAL